MSMPGSVGSVSQGKDRQFKITLKFESRISFYDLQKQTNQEEDLNEIKSHLLSSILWKNFYEIRATVFSI
jgi:hypothetical protein